ncbi:hypothetical protein C8Q77DRAFT_23362 [Trametes polyzona]|nr:hypothetical protein C8Q77DRAFT_23362 [Trametes polyzona]
MSSSVNADTLGPDTVEALTKMFPFDEKLYSLEGEELAFFKAQTGIEDEDELRKHVVAVAREAYAVFPFPCIQRYAFIQFKLPRLRGYDRLLKLGQEREGAILLDIGCCFGNDVRCAAADGFPAKQIIASDLFGDYWTLGHKLFRSTPESFPAMFIAGDAFDAAHLDVAPPIYTPRSEPTPGLQSLTSLNPLHGHIAAIHASSFFHLFNEAQQTRLAHALGGLLSPLPGSMIIGQHAGALVKGSHNDKLKVKAAPEDAEGDSSRALDLFCHSPESWKELWDGEVFRKGSVRVEVEVVERSVGDASRTGVKLLLQWTVTRL